MVYLFKFPEKAYVVGPKIADHPFELVILIVVACLVQLVDGETVRDRDKYFEDVRGVYHPI